MNEEYIRIFGAIIVAIGFIVLITDFPIKTHKEG